MELQIQISTPIDKYNINKIMEVKSGDIFEN